MKNSGTYLAYLLADDPFANRDDRIHSKHRLQTKAESFTFMSQDPSNDIIMAVRGSVVELFDTMLAMEITPVASAPEPSEDNEIVLVGFVSLAGKVNGSVNIRVSRTMARQMTAGMLGMEIDDIESDEEVKDVLREVCNIVAGGLKSNFCDAGLVCQISTPSITTGNNFQIQTLHMERYEEFVFTYGHEPIYVEIAVKFVAEDEADLQSILKLKKIDISKFQRLDIISSVGDSIIELFDTMLSLEVDLSDREPFQGLEDFRIMGAVDFAGGVHGSIQFQVSKTFARMITAGMLGQDLEEVQDIDTVKDVIGEMTNILGGNLKAAFCDTGLDCQISTPSLTVGLDFHIEILNMDRYERFAFKLNDHDILVEVCVKIDEPESERAGVADTAGQAEAARVLDDDAIQKMIAEANREQGEDIAPAAAVSENDSRKQLDDEAIQALLASANKSAEPSVTAPEQELAQRQAGAPDGENRSATDAIPAMPPLPSSPETGSEEADAEMPANVSFIRDIPVHIVVELGRTKMNIKDILGLGKGSAVVLSNLEGETLDIRANNRLIAKGEVLVENDKYGIRIKEIVGAAERVGRLIG